MKTFTEFFGEATGHEPPEYLARFARDGLPGIAGVPVGADRAGAILAWLWRRLHGPDPAAIPRRLIYALPQRALTEQVSGRLRRWLANLGLADEVALTVAQAARWQSRGAWRDDPHRPAIVVGTADVLVSKALNRALDMDRALFPIDFALVTNGAHWLVDDPGLSPQTTATLRRLAGFAAELGTAEPFALTRLSPARNPIQIPYTERKVAPLTPPTAPRTVRRLPVDPGDHAAIAAAVLERHSPDALTLVVVNTVDAAQRVFGYLRADGAPCTLLHPRFRALEREPLTANLTDPALADPALADPALADPALADPALTGLGRPATPSPQGPLPSTTPTVHGCGNEPPMAGSLPQPSVLAGAERASEALGLVGGRIVVTAEVVEAGLELNPALLVTEAAPWPSLVRRVAHGTQAGRPGADADVWWLPPPGSTADQQANVDATVAELSRLEGERLTLEDLLARDVPAPEPEPILIAGADLVRLFDTAPDPSGDDVDIASFVSDAGDLDVEVAWAWWTAGEDGAPGPGVWVPAAEYRCRVPLGAVAAFARDRAVWRFDRLAGGWTRVADRPSSRPRPGDVLLVSAADGGYDPEAGFDPSASGPVPDCPELLTPDERAERAALAAADAALAAQRPLDPGAALLIEAADATERSLAEAAVETDAPAEDVDDGADDVGDAEEEPRRWQSLDEHSEQVRDQAAALLAVLAPDVPPAAARSAVVAGYLHDLGKAHEIWQDAICALADDEEQARIAAGRPWAKSGRDGPLLFAGDVAFRHELASLLFIDGPLTRLLAESPDPDLTRYLVLAHHGKLRVHVREYPDSESGDVIRGLRQCVTTPVPPMLGQPASTLTVDLSPFLLDDDRSWTRTVSTLLDRYGSFVLAYLETIVRVADWRASGGRELPAR